jgi:hypothetical protein
MSSNSRGLSVPEESGHRAADTRRARRQGPMLALVVACLTLSMAARAQDASTSANARVDMGDLSEYYGAPTVRINLGGMLVKLINAANDDPGSGALMEHLDTIRIDVYRTDGETGPALRHVEAMTQRLPKSGWEAVVQVRDMGDHAHILVKMDAETIVGMVVMAVSEEEAVFINIEGMIDPDSLAELTRRFDVDLSGDEDDGG